MIQLGQHSQTFNRFNRHSRLVTPCGSSRGRSLGFLEDTTRAHASQVTRHVRIIKMNEFQGIHLPLFDLNPQDSFTETYYLSKTK